VEEESGDVLTRASGESSRPGKVLAERCDSSVTGDSVELVRPNQALANGVANQARDFANI
jgi:hypothetical protein